MPNKNMYWTDEGLWKRLRIRAIKEGRGTAQIIQELVKKYLDEVENKSEEI